MNNILKFLILVILTLGVTAYILVNIPEPETNTYEFSEDVLWGLTQDWRLANDGRAYVRDERLCAYADKRALEAVIDWSHDGFNEDVDWYYEWLGFDHIAENLSRGFDTEQDTLDAWLNSQLHRLNLEADYTNSCTKCSGNTCAQIFGAY